MIENNIQLMNKESDTRSIFGLRSKGLFKVHNDIMPLISIIIPTYNSEKLLRETLKSVFNQTYSNYEIIIVDGKSKDNTISILKEYEDKIDLVISEPDRNIFDAINKGTYLSTGKYSVFLGSDDMLLPDSFAVIADNIKSFGYADYFWGDMYTLKTDGSTQYQKCYFNSINYGDFFMSHPSLYIRKDVFEELDGFNIKHHICADADFELKLILKGKRGIKIEKPLCIFRSGGHSSFKIKNVKQVREIFKNYNAQLGYKYYMFAVKAYTIFFLQKVFSEKTFTKIIGK